MTTPREHAELAILYFSDSALRCWVREMGRNAEWNLMCHPSFDSPDFEYYVGHEPPPPPKRTINVPAATIELRPGEHYAGLVLNDDGTPCHHLVLMAERSDQRMPWQQAKDWVWSINGAQPTQHEAAFIRAHCRNYIEPGGYWLDESERDPAYAWVYYFSTGSQYCIQKSSEARAIAVRRIPIGGQDE